jgi:hypothetical protein
MASGCLLTGTPLSTLQLLLGIGVTTITTWVLCHAVAAFQETVVALFLGHS